MSDIRARHQAWLTSVEKRLSQQADVFGLVAFGSTANVARVDEWSDHDLAIMVRVGSEDHYRDGSAWLPRLDAVVKSTVESQFARGVGLFLLGIMHGGWTRATGRERERGLHCSSRSYYASAPCYQSSIVTSLHTTRLACPQLTVPSIWGSFHDRRWSALGPCVRIASRWVWAP